MENLLIFAGAKVGFEVRAEWTQFLIGPESLPFSLTETPNKFTDFRFKIENVGLDKIIPAEASNPTLHRKPEALKLGRNSGIPLFNLTYTIASSFPEFAPEKTTPDTHEQEILNRVLRPNTPNEKFNILRGGEQRAQVRLTSYLFGKRDIAHYNSTRNGLRIS